MPPQRHARRHFRQARLYLFTFVFFVALGGQQNNLAASTPVLESGAAWIIQWGTAEADEVVAVAASPTGEIFAAGNTLGSLGGGAAGGGDIWVAKFDSQGERQWLHQFGGPAEDSVAALALGGGGQVLLAGATRSKLYADLPTNGGSLVLALTAEGEERWHAYLPHSKITNMVVNEDAIYVAGLKTQATTGSDDSADALVSALTLDGDLAWTTEVAGDVDNAAVVIAVRGNALVASGAEAQQDDTGNNALWTVELDEQGEVTRRGAITLAGSVILRRRLHFSTLTNPPVLCLASLRR